MTIELAQSGGGGGEGDAAGGGGGGAADSAENRELMNKIKFLESMMIGSAHAIDSLDWEGGGGGVCPRCSLPVCVSPLFCC